MTGVAAAAPVGSLTADVDSDGTADSIVMDGNGDLLIKTKKLGAETIVLDPAKHAAISFGVTKGIPTIAVVTDANVFVLQSPASKWNVIVRDKLDVGLDADYSVIVEPRTDGVYMYEARIGSQRCDKQPGMAFARVLAGTFRRLARLPTLIADNAPVINAKPDPNPARDAGLYRARFASHEPGATNVAELPMPVELDDGKAQTTWREDFKASDGEGQ
jgi:hypothetical protein